jgi:mannose-6-phosphate isomerase-like protein (cupin superfamily)
MAIRLDTPQNGFAIDWLGERIRLPIRTSDTGGQISAQLGDAPPGFTNPPHVHTREDEIFYVISGEIQIRVADKMHHLTASDLVFAPAGLPHQVSVVGNNAAKLLVLLTGDTIEQAFINASGKSLADLETIMGRAGVELLDHFDADYRPIGFESVASGSAIVCRADKGDAIWLAGDTYTIKLSGKHTGDRFAVVHFDIPSGGGPVPHIHTREFEAFVITKGEVELYADGDIVTGYVNDVAVLPTNIPHCFKNRTNSHSQMIAIVAPAGFDRFIRNAGQPAIAGQYPPPVNSEEMHRLIAAAAEFGVVLRPDIEF